MRKRKGRRGVCRAAVLASTLAGAGISVAHAALTVDVRLFSIDGVAATDPKTAEVTHYGQVFTFDVYASVTNPGHEAEVDLLSVQGSFRSDNLAGGFAAKGTIAPDGDIGTVGGLPATVVGLAPFNADGATRGESKDLLPLDGDKDLGGDDGPDQTGVLGFVAVRTEWTVPHTQTPGSVAVPDGREWKIGRITLTVDPRDPGTGYETLGAGSTEVNFFPRRNEVHQISELAGLWMEDSTVAGVKDGLNGTINVGSAVLLTRQEQWNRDGGGSWGVAENWAGTQPNAVGAKASFLGVLQGPNAPANVELNGNRTVGQIVFDNANSYNISQGTTGSLTINNGASAASINVVKGSHTISAPLSIAAGVVVNRTGSGTLTVSGAQTHGAGAVFNADAGVTNFDSDVGSNLSVNVNAATVKFNTSQNIAALNISNAGRVAIPGDKKVLDTSGFTIAGSTDAWSGQIDIDKNFLIVRHNDADGGTARAERMANQVLSAINGPLGWDGEGITSTAAKNDPDGGITTVAVQKNDDGAGNAIFADFGGKPVGNNAILVRYTYWGDCNLDGIISGDDYALMDGAFLDPTMPKMWLFGDINYDGAVTGDDYALIDGAYPIGKMRQLGNIGKTVAIQVIPEPGTLTLLALGSLALLGRRRRKL